MAEAIGRVAAHFGDRMGMIGFCGAPLTLASYMIEGGGSRNYIETKRLMYTDPTAWRALMQKLTTVLAEFAAQQVKAGADVIQIFDSWAGALSVTDYREYVLPTTQSLVRQVQTQGVPVIYFGVDTATLLPSMRETGADVVGLIGGFRWTLEGASWTTLRGAGQPRSHRIVRSGGFATCSREEVLRQAGGMPGHIFNVGHGIVPGTQLKMCSAWSDGCVRFVHR